jgi:hypothetical protein
MKSNSGRGEETQLGFLANRKAKYGRHHPSCLASCS